MLVLRYPYLKNVFLAFSDQNRTLKNNLEAGQRPTTRCWFLLDYSLSHYQIGRWAIIFPSSFMINFRIGNIWPIYQSLDKRIWFTVLSSLSELHCVPNIGFLCWTITNFVPNGVIKDRTTKMYPKYFNGKLWPYQLSCFINSFLYYPACKAWLFEKLIFELEASYSFNITCILVRQVISLKKVGSVISKILCLVSWFPICTPLILLSALMKLASISTTVIYNSMSVETPDKLLI